jgi:hypothetical protein
MFNRDRSFVWLCHCGSYVDFLMDFPLPRLRFRFGRLGPERALFSLP